MQEKKKQTAANPAAQSTAFGGSDVPVNKNVSISSGPYAEELPVSGMTVGQVRKKYADRFDIAPNAQSIINGNVAKDDVVLQPGEALMFIQHAGEKGVEYEDSQPQFTLNGRVVSDDVVLKVGDVLTFIPHIGQKGASGEVVIAGDKARFSTATMELPTLLERAGPGISTGPVILPRGVKSIQSRGNITLWIWEQPPCIHRLSWIAADSKKAYGPGTKYRWVKIALPYLIIAATFARDAQGYPVIIGKDECFFRNDPLKSMNDELCYPGLLNCSLWSNGDTDLSHPLSWICTQHLKPNYQMNSTDIGDRYQGGFEAVRYCLLETSFNLSSEHNEGNSWFSKTKEVDPRIATIEEWEKNTAKDPLFVLDVPWIPTQHTLGDFCERIFKQHSGSAPGGVKSAADLGRIIVNG